VIIAGKDFSAMQIYNPLAQEKTDACAALPVNRIFGTLLRLVKAVENFFQIFCHKAMSRIAYIHIE